MGAQQQTFPEIEHAKQAAKSGPEPAPVWLQRLSLVVLVLFCFLVGGVLTILPWPILPWSSRYWDHNGWLLAHPAIQLALDRGWVRGLVSGLGIMDIWIGVSELLHYREYRGK